MAKKTATKKATKEKVPFEKDFRPGKGASLTLDMLEQLYSISDLLNDLEVQETASAREALLKRTFGDPIEVDLKYGKKWLVRCFENRPGHEFRVAVVIRDDALRVDAREWYDPSRNKK